MLKPKVINEVAVLTQAISVRSCERIVRSKENLVLASIGSSIGPHNCPDVDSVFFSSDNYLDFPSQIVQDEFQDPYRPLRVLLTIRDSDITAR